MPGKKNKYNALAVLMYNVFYLAATPHTDNVKYGWIRALITRDPR